MNYFEMNKEQLEAEKLRLDNEYNDICAKGLSLDLSRGKPGRAQLDLMTDMLTCISKDEDCFTETVFGASRYS